MGFTIDADGMRVDTGFVNTSAFTMAYESLPTNVGWDPVNVVLPTDQSDVWVMIGQSDEDITPTLGRSMDHLGWATDDLDEFGQNLLSNNVEFTMDPTPFRGIRISFIEGPEGVRIEVVEPD